ncbi:MULTISPECIES: helix-turn-helix domain-containing protein [unclassified Microbacterium]|uniref:helix-turn-helix domain-containing protein n=1 Tax=unclassified Microbacterium TaxID=2609290 RepID=UPI0009DA15F5|nr:helix-turn-helix domain-containing protein [Microbacterium sp. UCD-TDU]
MTSAEVARVLSVSEATLSRWRSSEGGPPFVNLLGVFRYQIDELAEWVEGNRS